MLLESNSFNETMKFFERNDFDLENENLSQEFCKLMNYRLFSNDIDYIKYRDDIDYIFTKIEKNNSIIKIVENLAEWSTFIHEYENSNYFNKDLGYDRLNKFVFDYIIDYIENGLNVI